MAEPSDAPRRFEDLPWRLGWRLRRALMAVYGPPQLSGDDDPVRALERERAEHRAARRRP